jgi:hypothetical protein
MRWRDFRVLIAGGGIGGIPPLSHSGSGPSTPSCSSRRTPFGRSEPASSSVRMRPGYSGPWGWAGRWRASPSTPRGETTVRGTPASASSGLRSASGQMHISAPYHQVHRADLLDILVRALGDTSIHLNARVQAFEQDGHGLTMTLADGRTVTGDVLVGADGIHSTV